MQRNLLCDLLTDLVGESAYHRRVDVSRHDDVGAEGTAVADHVVVAGPFEREHAGVRDEAGFGGGVGGCADDGFVGEEGGDVDGAVGLGCVFVGAGGAGGGGDGGAAAAGVDVVGEELFGEVDGGVEVGGEDGVLVRSRGFEHGAVFGDAGAVDQGVEVGEGVHYLGDPVGFVVGDVCYEGRDGSIVEVGLLLDACDCFVGSVCVSRDNDYTASSFLDETLRNGEAYAAGTSRKKHASIPTAR